MMRSGARFLMVICWAWVLSGGLAWGQARTQRRIGTAEEFNWPGSNALAWRSVGGLLDSGEVVGTVLFDIYDYPGNTSIASKWTLDDGFTYITPSAQYGAPLSLHRPEPYPYGNANQHGMGFLSAEPGGRMLAYASDNRTESPGVTGLYNMDPTSTFWVREWSIGPGAWLPFANNPQFASNGMIQDIDFCDYGGARIFPGGYIVTPATRQRCRAVEYSVTPPYWRWQAEGALQALDFRVSPGGARIEYKAPGDWPSGSLTEYSVNRAGKTVGMAMKLLPSSNLSDWQGVLWPDPQSPQPISSVVGVPKAFPQHITEAGEIGGVIPSLTTNPRYLTELEAGRVFLWLPTAKWGLPAGMNYLTPAGQNARFVGMNDRGFVVYEMNPGTASSTYHTWSSGSDRVWSFTSETWSEITPTGMMNNKGWIVCYGTRIDNQTTDYVLSYPVMDLDLTVEPKEVELCDEFELVATVTSRSQYNLTGLAQVAPPEIVGDNNATILSGPTPSGPQTLAAGATMQFRWRCRARGVGEARFAVEMRGTAANGQNSVYRTLKTTSDPIKITRPDLIVNQLTDQVAADETELSGDIDLNTPGRQVTLRSALRTANALAGKDIIYFDLPAASNKTIALTSRLPAITEACEIRGQSQPGGQLVTVNVQGAFGVGETRQAAIETRATVIIDGLAITGTPSSHAAIRMSQGQSTVERCLFGIGADGKISGSNDVAIQVLANGQQIGGSGRGNRFGMGNAGIVVGDGSQPGAVSGCVIEGNVFGVLDSGFTRQGAVNGVVLVNAASCRVGGTSEGSRNHFRCSKGAAVSLVGSLCTDNDITGNWMGLNDSGARVFGSDQNGYGVALALGAHHNRIGGSSLGAGNVLSASDSAGVLLTRGAHDNVITGNWIGLNGTGNDSASNEIGVLALSGNNNRIGGSTPGQRNVISGNRTNGIVVGRSKEMTFKAVDVDPGSESSTNTVIEGNWIGLDASGTHAVPNGAISYVAYQGILVGRFANGTVIGGNTQGRSNVISGNNCEGIRVDADAATAHAIWGNNIGTSVDGLSAHPNLSAGVTVVGEPVVIIGGQSEFTPNRIAYNKGPGVQLQKLKGNVPGIPLGGNLIHDNAAAGSISLARTRSANDSNDADTGPNGLQNWPLLVAAANLTATATNVVFDLSSFARGVQVRVDVFKASGGGGSVLIGSKLVTTGSDPDDRYIVDVALQFVGAEITALATTGDGTSEFSQTVKVVSGVDSDHDGLPDALENQVPVTPRAPRLITLSDRNGDGIADSTQANVTSVQVPDDGEWFTLAGSSTQTLTDLIGLRAADVPRLPGSVRIQPGAVRFRVGGSPLSGPMTLVLSPQLSTPTLWIWGSSGWSQIAGVTVTTDSGLWRLSFTLPADATSKNRLLAVGQPEPVLSPPSMTLLPREQRRADSSTIVVEGVSPDGSPVPPPSQVWVQPVTITRPPEGGDWLLESSEDLQAWEVETSDQPVYPASPGRFFRWRR